MNRTRRIIPSPIRTVAATCGLLAAITLSASAQGAPPDGNWTVHGRGVMGTGCGDWFVRLNNAQGRLSGIVGLGDGNVPL